MFSSLIFLFEGLQRDGERFITLAGAEKWLVVAKKIVLWIRVLVTLVLPVIDEAVTIAEWYYSRFGP